jgi:hypothetical protein
METTEETTARAKRAAAELAATFPFPRDYDSLILALALAYNRGALDAIVWAAGGEDA